MNLMYDLINKFGSGNVGINRVNGILKIDNADVCTVIDFVRPTYDDIVNMIVVEGDSVVLYCNPDSEFKIKKG